MLPKVTVYRYGHRAAVYVGDDHVMVAERLYGYERLLRAVGVSVDTHDIDEDDLPARVDADQVKRHLPRSLAELQCHLTGLERRRLLEQIERRREELSRLEAMAAGMSPAPEKVAGAHVTGTGV